MAAEIAYNANVPVYMDVGGKELAWDDHLYPFLYCICPNETELTRLTQLPTGTLDEAVCAAKHLLKNTALKQILVTLGKLGAFLLTPDEYYFQEAFPVDANLILDTTGAGDCFRAAFIVELLSSQNINKALQFASAASAICIQQQGAMPSMPTNTRVQCYLQEFEN